MHDMRLIHTDLKPENILFVSPEYVKIPDYKVYPVVIMMFLNYHLLLLFVVVGWSCNFVFVIVGIFILSFLIKYT